LVTKTLSTSVRQDAETYPGNLAIVQGIALGPTPYVQVIWPWLLFLVSELILAMVFLLATALMTRWAGMQVIKGSSLATMCALDDETRRHVGWIYDFEDMKERAEHTNVKLETAPSGAALWLSLVSRR
jgi:hypothetical protein